MTPAIQADPTLRPRRRCEHGRHVADPRTVRSDDLHRRAICRRCRCPIVRAVASGGWIVSTYLG